MLLNAFKITSVEDLGTIVQCIQKLHMEKTTQNMFQTLESQDNNF